MTIQPPLNSRLTIGNPFDAHRILVVDDEPAVLFAYQKLIEKDGMAVDISTSFEDAVRYIIARSYLAVIADMRLAGTNNEDGLEILRIIQKVRPDTKMILATGFGYDGIDKIAQDMGVSHYFNKPVPPSAIMEALRKFHADAAKLPVGLS